MEEQDPIFDEVSRNASDVEKNIERGCVHLDRVINQIFYDFSPWLLALNFSLAFAEMTNSSEPFASPELSEGRNGGAFSSHYSSSSSLYWSYLLPRKLSEA